MEDFQDKEAEFDGPLPESVVEDVIDEDYTAMAEDIERSEKLCK